MNITDIVDVEKYPYVWPYGGQYLPIQVDGQLLYIPMVRGLLSDGASGVIDLSLHAFFGHDTLFLKPVVLTDHGKRVRLCKGQVDRGYGWMLAEDGHKVRGKLRFWGLGKCPGVSNISQNTWDRYRERELNEPDWFMDERVVPHAREWRFPSHWTKDAIYQPHTAPDTTE